MKDASGKYKHHGLFEKIEDAVAKRSKVAIENGYSERHGINA